MSGNKRDDRFANLKALCIDCHRKQPMHEYMRVKHEDMVLINKLRKQQGLLTVSSWAEVRDVADQSLDGLLRFYEKKNMHLPHVSHELSITGKDVVAELEIAWPHKKRGIAIAQQDLEQARAVGWKVLTVGEALKEMNK